MSVLIPVLRRKELDLYGRRSYIKDVRSSLVLVCQFWVGSQNWSVPSKFESLVFCTLHPETSKCRSKNCGTVTSRRSNMETTNTKIEKTSERRIICFADRVTVDEVVEMLKASKGNQHQRSVLDEDSDQEIDIFTPKYYGISWYIKIVPGRG